MKMNKKLEKNKSGENFGFGLAFIVLSMAISILAFISEGSKITGFATLSQEDIFVKSADLRDFEDVDSLGRLAQGNYYIDNNGIVYWIDDESMPAVGQLNIVEDSQKNRHIYIDSNGRIVYVLSSIPIST